MKLAMEDFGVLAANGVTLRAEEFRSEALITFTTALDKVVLVTLMIAASHRPMAESSSRRVVSGKGAGRDTTPVWRS
jgi:hypothetical protein